MVPGAAQAVADHAGSLKVMADLAAGMTAQGGLVISDLLLGIVGSLAQSVVLRGRAAVTKMQYTPCGK